MVGLLQAENLKYLYGDQFHYAVVARVLVSRLPLSLFARINAIEIGRIAMHDSWCHDHLYRTLRRLPVEG